MRAPWFRAVEADRQMTDLRDSNTELTATVGLLQESLAELQLAMDDAGWTRIVAAGQQEFTRDGLSRISAAARVYTVKSPLLTRGLALRSAYVWGSGVHIGARATGKNRENPAEQDVNTVVQGFLDDVGNRRALIDASAQLRSERCLFTDGNLFVSLWTRPRTGAVTCRILPWDEIQDVICNPNDSSDPWFYKRTFTQNTLDYGTGSQQPTQRTVYYPALGYRPAGAQKPRTIGGDPVQWDAPVRHVKVNDEQGWRFGVGDAYPALDWAKAYKEFLEDWAKLVRSLSKFAWRLTAKGSARAQARTRLATAPTDANGIVREVGNVAILPPDQSMDAIPKSGATIDSESGRPLAMMVAAALNVPVTMLLSDPGQTGARAVAETLDRPTELVMQQRREVWGEALRDILAYVIAEAVRAPAGRLKGTVVTDPDVRQDTVLLDGNTETTVDITWPDLDDVDPAALVAAVKTASDTGTVPPEIILRWLLTALGERNVDEIVDRVTSDDGEFLWPSPPGGSDTAVLARAGADPASAGTGSMRPDPGADDDPADGEDSAVL